MSKKPTSSVSDTDVLLEAKLALAQMMDGEITATPELGEAQPVVPSTGPIIQARARVYDDREQKIVSGRLWLISFTDLFSLMLCFFLMIFSTKDLDLKNLHKSNDKSTKGIIMAAVQKGFAGGEDEMENISNVEYGDALNLDYLEGVLKNSITEAKLEGQVKISQGRDYLKLGVDSADTSVAKGLAERLMKLSNRIVVVYLPSSSGGWADGITQATNFAEAMRDGGYRKPFTVLADGSGRGDGIEIRVEADDGRLR